MPNAPHYRALENMYQAAPINRFFPPQMTVSQGTATIKLHLKQEYHHTAGAVHGSVYFKLLDDAAFFAVNSLEKEVFVLTTAFTTYITRPVVEGTMTAVGRVMNTGKSQWLAESVVYDDKDREIARGNGIFVRSKIRLATLPEYAGHDSL
ncbi:PaaI family thioesterase [Desulfoluna sp.]|uniref:PaaI family thioesterase n=1 Tax=Desulfoluna sp. TaxID=2045199 RepID=UPI00260C0DAB|nr:PaaI family thioesterase [Desulfoluna sp.]